jgi:hypothetical protein
VKGSSLSFSSNSLPVIGRRHLGRAARCQRADRRLHLAWKLSGRGPQQARKCHRGRACRTGRRGGVLVWAQCTAAVCRALSPALCTATHDELAGDQLLRDVFQSSTARSTSWPRASASRSRSPDNAMHRSCFVTRRICFATRTSRCTGLRSAAPRVHPDRRAKRPDLPGRRMGPTGGVRAGATLARDLRRPSAAARERQRERSPTRATRVARGRRAGVGGDGTPPTSRSRSPKLR